jgi:phosphoglycerol transferase
MSGTSDTIVWDALLRIVLVGVLVAAFEALLYLFVSGRLADKLKNFGGYLSYSASRVATFFKKRFMPIASMTLVLSILIFIFRLGIHSFVANVFTKSDFIESHYADPDKTNITFPEEKRNLIYIFLESMETTFADTSAGGNIIADFIPELSLLASENVSFSYDGKHGAYTYVGTKWTAAAMFAQTSGVIIKVPLNFDSYSDDGTYMPGISTLGDILEREGYEQSLLLGSDAGFAARDVYFTEHGNYNIIDVNSLKEDGKLPEDYWEWWGFEDAKVFDFAKEELLRLAETGKPFNFTTLTADTHFPDGYECELCGDEYEEQYANVLACSSKQVYEFINWIKEQPFYENTTIVLSGDHLTMDPEFLADIEEDYIRTTYNCIINPAIEPVRETGREFATFDMFPTTLAALGVDIEGDRLGIGTNLFSSVETLTEKYGYDKVEEELCKRSEFYTETFFDPDIKSKENE